MPHDWTGIIMTIKMVRSLYHDILKEVLMLEVEKKEIAQRILILKSDMDRLPLIKDFLQTDLSKHQLLEQAAVTAMQNQVSEVLDHISRLYTMTDGISLIQCIRAEINRDQKMLALLGKEMKHPDNRTFSERRILREVNKYVIFQAREYARTNS